MSMIVSTDCVQLVIVQCDVKVETKRHAKQGFQLELAWLAAARMANRKVQVLVHAHSELLECAMQADQHTLAFLLGCWFQPCGWV